MWQSLPGALLLPLLAVAQPLQAFAQQTQPPAAPPLPQWGPGPWHMMGDGYGWHFWWMPPFMMLFFLALCVAVFFLLFGLRPWGCAMRHAGPPWHAGSRTLGPPTHSALQILNERFAKGEIQKDEYEERKAALLAGGPF